MILLRLFGEFFLIGLFAFGGGMATLPFLQDLSERTSWFTLSQLADMVAIAEATPGPIGVNLATYAGYNTAGIPGVLAATTGIVTPSVIIILIIAKILEKFRNNSVVDSAFYGLRPASCALICAAAITILRSAVFTPAIDWRAFVLLILLIPPVLGTKLHPLVFLGIAAVAGIIIKL